MKVDFFKDKYSVIPVGRAKDVSFYLERIRYGEVKDKIISIRAELNKNDRDNLKGQLTAVTFCGTFTRRAKNGLKEGSGLAIVDFDKLKTHDDVLLLKDKLSKDTYIFSVWISPSGNGLKALVKIPVVVDNDDYNKRYKAIYNHFLWVNDEFKADVIDTSGQDISRLCFESYDPNIYINYESQIFTDFIEEEKKLDFSTLGTVTNIPLNNQDEIANRLMIWFKKHYNPSQRNNSFFKLAAAFNDFGVDQITCENYILPNAQKDFDEDEIKALITSAYKNKIKFGSQTFEDTQSKDAIIGMVKIGKSDTEIFEKFPDRDKDAIKKEIDTAKAGIDLKVFWSFDDKGKLKISPHRLKFYLEHNTFYKHYPISNSKTFTFIKKDDNFVDEVSEYNIKDYVLKQQMDNLNFDVYDLLAASTRTFTPAYLSMLDTAQFTVEDDGKDFSWIYYKNCALKVTQDKYEKFDYQNLNGFVWKKQVIDRDLIDADHHESEYRTFIWFCSGQNVSRYNSLKSVIGYLMHSFKTSANNKAIIFNDETISDNPNGGSGKSLFWNALSHIKKVATIDGKTFEFSKSFPYQSVPVDTQLLVFDDVKKNFNFENLFSLITEGITLEYKGQDAIKLPVQKSPKIIITTNYTINGVGGSFERRKFEVEMSSYFNANHSPLDHFNHMLFDDWDQEEWARFDHFMINCLKYYLKNGLVEFTHNNLENRKLINDTSLEFLEWIKETDTINENYQLSKNYVFDRFIDENKDYKQWLKQKRFTQWIKRYCEFYGKKYTEGNTNGSRWFMIESPKNNDTQPDVWDNITPIKETPF
jgi:hypothetical protein